MTDQIVLAFHPSESMKDWQLRFEDDKVFYEARVRFYDMGCGKLSSGYCSEHPRQVGEEPYYNLRTEQIVEPPRTYITHYPKRGEWENYKTINDVIESPLYIVKRKVNNV